MHKFKRWSHPSHLLLEELERRTFLSATGASLIGSTAQALAVSSPKLQAALSINPYTQMRVGESSSLTVAIYTLGSGLGGRVDIYDNNRLLQSADPSKAIAFGTSYELDITLGPLPPGKHTFMAAWTGDDFRLAANSAPVSVFVSSDPNTRISVLALYTDTTLQQAGGINQLQAAVYNDFSNATSAFSNSVIPVRPYLAGLVHVNYKEAGNYALDLSRLANPNDGYLDNVPALRNQFGADVVLLLDSKPAPSTLHPSNFTFGDSTDFGKLTAPDSERNCFIVISYTANGDFLFAHELGHVLGAAHAVGDSGDPPSAPYGYGYRFTDHFGNLVRDVMAYPPGGLIPYYATPYATYLDTPVGNTTTSNLALLFSQTAPIVASFRPARIISGIDRLDQHAITGWAYDSLAPSAPLYVRLVVDGTQVQVILADNDRPDLVAAFGWEFHGFQAALPQLSTGDHKLELDVTDSTGATALIARRTLTVPPLLFDTSYYLAHNPDVAAAVAAGKTTAWNHFLAAGQYELRNPSAYFDASYYLAHNPDIAAAWSARKIPSPWQHYFTVGQYEQRKASPAFDERFYRATYPDVAQAIAAGIIRNGLTHYLIAGRFENRLAFAL